MVSCEREGSRSLRSAAFAGANATIKRSNGKRGLIAFDFIRSVGGPRKSKVRRKPTPTTSNWRSQMTLIKSLLLGSAAGIVAVASAQAADLPTKKAAPVEYVKVCNVGGITGWTLPGSDTCVKFSGYITAQFDGGNLNTQYNYGLDFETRLRPPRILSFPRVLLSPTASGGYQPVSDYPRLLSGF